MLAYWGNTCAEYGFTVDTDAYAECVQKEKHAAAEKNRAIHRSAKAAVPPAPKLCTTYSSGATYCD